MGIYDNIKDIVKIFNNDEILLRLLYYYPKNISKTNSDPLDPNLDNIIGNDVYWEIIEDRIMLTPKSSDLDEKKICRIYVYAGRRKPMNGSYLFSTQQVRVDILCHFDYEKDLRSMRISDRINELLVGNRATGIGKVSYVNGDQIGAPEGYVGYSHVYEFGSMDK